MIILPTRRRLEQRRDKLYSHLEAIVNCASIHQVEDILRQIHIINLRLKTYFKSTREPEEYFNDNEDNGITEKDTAPSEVSPTKEELDQIEEQIKTGEI